ncbi:MAG TPA: CoA pyrophosphatase [Cyclobacteriaceae bacterium]|nr:CoA pyrophosphatase [Cyclobacteriaceae bacterium]
MEAFIQRLQERLALPLPGEAAQMYMAPSSRRVPPFYLSRSESHRISSVMIMLYKEKNQWKFPLIQLPLNSGVHSGQMALPGGRMEESDEDRIVTAIRETREEIGVESADMQVLGVLTELHIQASQNTVLPVVSYIPGKPEYSPDPAEVESIHIVTLAEIADEKRRKVTDIQVTDNITIEAPYYDVEGKIIWGATAMILSEFLHIIREIIPGKTIPSL